MAAGQSASTSSHLQAWTGVVVDDPVLREEVALCAGDQNQIRTASLFIAFCADVRRLAVVGASENPDALSLNELYTTAVIDAALAAERMACAAEALGLGICYIGALRNQPERIAELLGLPEGVAGLFGLCIGFPSGEASIKPRLGFEVAWPKNCYNDVADVAEFDSRMAGFYASQGMKADVPWSARSGRRCQKSKISGRERFGAFLKARGLDVE
jgi:nitroreductase